MDLSFLFDLEGATLCEFPKGHCLAYQEDMLAYIYYLLEGSCERIEYSDCGDEIIYNTKMADADLNAIIGLSNLWCQNFVSFSSFIAKTPLRCLKIDALTARKALLQRPDILDAIKSGAPPTTSAPC